MTGPGERAQSLVGGFAAQACKQQSIETEWKATVTSAIEAGIDVLPGIGEIPLLSIFGAPFVPTQLHEVEDVPTVPTVAKFYYGFMLRPELADRAERGDERTLRLAFQAGRFLGALRAHDMYPVRPPYVLGPNGIDTDEQHVAQAAGQGRIVELGLGINGLLSLVEVMKAGDRQVTGIHKTRGEVAFLSGIAAYSEVPAAQLELSSEGIPRGIDDVLKSGRDEEISLVVASRVHWAGQDLLKGMQRTGEMLSPGGVVIVRGPRRFEGGAGCDQVLEVLQRQPELEVVIDHRFEQVGTSGTEQSGLVVAQRR
jgi:hypothetical protein